MIPIETSKRAYRDLADYAARQGAPSAAFQTAGWRETVHKGRPALEYPTPTGPRWRYLDGLEPRHDSPYGYRPSWYLLEPALALAGGRALVLVNGAAAVVVAQSYAVPAFAVSSGEMAAPTPAMLRELQAAGVTEILIASDSDQTGQRQAKRARLFLDAGILCRAVDLGLGEHGDFADFCKLHGRQAYERLAAQPEIPPEAPQQVRITYSSDTRDQYAEFERAVVIPAIERAAHTGQGRHFHCLNPEHQDEHPSARVGQGRNGLLYYCTCGTFKLSTVARWLGLDFRDWLRQTYPGTFKPALQGKRQSRQRPPSTAANPTVQPAAVSLPLYTASHTVSAPFITQAISPADLLRHRTVAIKSPTGTDKTGLAAALVAALPPDATVISVTHRVSLTHANAQRLGLYHYQSFTPEYSGIAPRISTTIDSIMVQRGRQVDCLITDEASQVLAHLAAAGTLKKHAALALETLEQLIRDARFVLLADAGLTDTVIAWVERLRGPVYTIENRYRPARGRVVFLDSLNGAIQTAVNQVGGGGSPVLIPCATQSTARHLHKLLSQTYPHKRGRLICARNSETDDTRQFVADIHTALPQLDWLVYTSSMGTGVNIQTEGVTVVGIGGQPVQPSDFLQMVKRARKASAYFIYVPDCAGNGETDAEAILADQLAAAHSTARRGILAPDATARALARLEAEVRAQRNREMTAYRAYLAAYLSADGSNITQAEQAASAQLKATLKAIRQAEADTRKADTLDLSNPTISNELLDRLRLARLEITDRLLAGNLRYQIERASGLQLADLSEDRRAALYDRLYTFENRHRLGRFASLIDEETALAGLDGQQAVDRLPLHLRRHWAEARRTFLAILEQAFGIQTLGDLKTTLVDIPKPELEARVAFIGLQHGDDLRRFLGHRDGHDASKDNPVGLFRWLCAGGSG